MCSSSHPRPSTRCGARSGSACAEPRTLAPSSTCGWALLRNPWNATPAERERLSTLPKRNRVLYRAYLLKEALADIYRNLYTPPWARRRLEEWVAWAARSRLDPFRKVARTIKRCFDGVLAYFATGFTTSRAEGLNTKARLATRQAYGFHSAEAVRAMIDLRCTGITIPLPHQRVVPVT